MRLLSEKAFAYGRASGATTSAIVASATAVYPANRHRGIAGRAATGRPSATTTMTVARMTARYQLTSACAIKASAKTSADRTAGRSRSLSHASTAAGIA